jgi:hypothetical protein
MIIHWDFVKKRTLWTYEELIQKLCQTLNYPFVQQHYNHSMDDAIDHVNEVQAGYLQHRGDRAWLDGLITNFHWLRRAGIENYRDLLERVADRDKCEAFLRRSGLGFPELIETLNYLLRWVLPFPTPLRELLNPADTSEKAYWEALKEQGITTNLDLLELGRTPAQRARVAEATRIPQEFLLRLLHQADLARLAYVRGKIVRHLCASGYDTLAKVASADLEEMEAAMQLYLESQGKRFADYKAVLQLAGLVGGARSLPKVVEN